MSKLQEQVTEFHIAFGLPVNTQPVVPPDDQVRLRASLVLEETFELIGHLFDASSSIGASQYTTAELLRNAYRSVQAVIRDARVDVDLVEVVDAFADIDYSVESARLFFGVDGGPIADEVHRANMAKLGAGRRTDGKILKPAGWTPPDIAGVLQKQKDLQPLREFLKADE